jgi:hypothetical protein
VLQATVASSAVVSRNCPSMNELIEAKTTARTRLHVRRLSFLTKGDYVAINTAIENDEAILTRVSIRRELGDAYTRAL